ncbi:hypothetical protein TNCV_4386021 [Trichonephila clavipes]|uniref:Uncharacterized protein n=1 Tax=Trichonephila inaurata madagascariensis TaxID=2747483 RepID=A0A8X6YSS9_9ARAC|nr:hypothetical protein TNCV_4386021 [Trichonephila clavipes]GFY75827.1 hypothetical protein TNIN_204981 [Trichonephila inaurata madagascariensis]
MGQGIVLLRHKKSKPTHTEPRNKRGTEAETKAKSSTGIKLLKFLSYQKQQRIRGPPPKPGAATQGGEEGPYATGETADCLAGDPSLSIVDDFGPGGPKGTVYRMCRYNDSFATVDAPYDGYLTRG